MCWRAVYSRTASSTRVRSPNPPGQPLPAPELGLCSVRPAGLMLGSLPPVWAEAGIPEDHSCLDGGLLPSPAMRDTHHK